MVEPVYGWLVTLCMAGRWVQNALVRSQYHPPLYGGFLFSWDLAFIPTGYVLKDKYKTRHISLEIYRVFTKTVPMATVFSVSFILDPLI